MFRIQIQIQDNPAVDISNIFYCLNILNGYSVAFTYLAWVKHIRNNRQLVGEYRSADSYSSGHNSSPWLLPLSASCWSTGWDDRGTDFLPSRLLPAVGRPRCGHSSMSVKYDNQ